MDDLQFGFVILAIISGGFVLAALGELIHIYRHTGSK